MSCALLGRDLLLCANTAYPHTICMIVIHNIFILPILVPLEFMPVYYKRFNPIHLFYSHPILSVILHSEYWSTISHEMLCELLVGCLSMSCLALIGQTSFDKIQPGSGISKQLPGIRSRSSSTIGAADELLFTA